MNDLEVCLESRSNTEPRGCATRNSVQARPKVKFKIMEGRPQELPLPTYKTAGAAGMDLVASEAIEIEPLKRVSVRTHLQIELQPGYEGQVRSRSGLAIKDGIHVLNAPGTIDEDYRGEIACILHNTDDRRSFFVEPGDRIAQLIIVPVQQAEVEIVNELSSTERGENGFGSTGVK